MQTTWRRPLRNRGAAVRLATVLSALAAVGCLPERQGLGEVAGVPDADVFPPDADIAPGDAEVSGPGADSSPRDADLAAPDAGTPVCPDAAAVAPPACPGYGTDRLVDSFDDPDGDPDADLWAYNGDDLIVPSLKSGRLVFAVPQGPPGYATLRSQDTYDLSACQVFVHLVAPPAAEESAYAGLGVAAAWDGSTRMGVGTVGGRLSCSHTLGQGWTEVCDAPYDPAQHAWLRLRGHDGAVSFEASPDGVCWTTLGTETAPFDIAHVQVDLDVSTHGDVLAPLEIAFDDLNVPR